MLNSRTKKHDECPRSFHKFRSHPSHLIPACKLLATPSLCTWRGHPKAFCGAAYALGMATGCYGSKSEILVMFQLFHMNHLIGEQNIHRPESFDGLFEFANGWVSPS